MLAELGHHTGDPTAFDEAFTFHSRTIALNLRTLTADPLDASVQRNLAGARTDAAYARVLANRELATAEADADLALLAMKALAAADPANAEAQQDLSFAHYIRGLVHRSQRNASAAARQFEEAVAILDPLVAARPGNVEAAADLTRLRRELAQN